MGKKSEKECAKKNKLCPKFQNWFTHKLILFVNKNQQCYIFLPNYFNIPVNTHIISQFNGQKKNKQELKVTITLSGLMKAQRID